MMMIMHWLVVLAMMIVRKGMVLAMRRRRMMLAMLNRRQHSWPGVDTGQIFTLRWDCRRLQSTMMHSDAVYYNTSNTKILQRISLHLKFRF